MALASATFLKPQTALQQLLEEINFQRTKEMRQLLKDDGGFVVLQGTTYWTDLFVRHFLFQSETDQNIDSDDLLFFVRKKHVKGSSRHMPKYETDVDVYRKDSRKLPIGDPDVDWEETVYLNLIIHQFNYTLTLAICTRTSPKELQVLRRHSQRVYASPSRRKMDTKGDGEEMTYPHICFMVDNFDEVFGDIMVRDGEMVCVELVASDRDGTVQGVIFLGSIRYDALKKVYDARQSSISSKLAQRMTFGLFSSGGPQTRCEFVRMKGPQGKGHAEMAVTKPKGSGVETPTSEPGFCATDMWDEWDEDPDDFLNYRHQRRLSDPSANLNNYSRYGWKTKGTGPESGTAGGKARSENEGLDSLASEVSEIEAGDLKDDRPAPLASVTHVVPDKKSSTKQRNTDRTTCCNCFGPIRKKHWTDATSGQMSEVYCRVCDDEIAENGQNVDNDSPACLARVTTGNNVKPRNLLSIESELEMPEMRDSPLRSAPMSPYKAKPHIDRTKTIKLNGCDGSTTTKTTSTTTTITTTASSNPLNPSNNNGKPIEEYELADDATGFDGDISDSVARMNVLNEDDEKRMIRVHGQEELPAEQTSPDAPTGHSPKYRYFDKNHLMNEIAQIKEETQTYLAENNLTESAQQSHINTGQQNGQHNNCRSDVSSTDRNQSVSQQYEIHSKDNTNIKNAIGLERSTSVSSVKSKLNYVNCTNDHPLMETETKNMCAKINDFDYLNGNTAADMPLIKRLNRFYATLPRMKKPILQQIYNTAGRGIKKVPTRVTPDGTTIYYWCDLSKQAVKELDDGAYNPLWATKGFTQTFHFWKEHRRQQSIPLNAFLTYVTLPWWSIAKDLLDHRETPILTF